MPILGAHMSIAGGYYRAVEAAQRAGCDCVQLFTKNSNQWRAKPISDDDVARFRAALDSAGIEHTVSHDSYLINLASPDDVLWKKSTAAFVEELQRAARLGIPWVVTHPGAFTTSTPDEGLARIVKALNAAHRATRKLRVGTLLETTAGQGSTLGHRFEHLATILDAVADSKRVGICVDTCHLFAAGYALGTKREFLATFRELDRRIGIERIRCFHLNDSKTKFGSRVDRHASIGLGHLGVEPFRMLLRDRRFRRIPMYLETPKGTTDDGRDWDVVNLEVLRGLGARE